MQNMHIDLETFSGEPLDKAGLYKYTEHPDFTILLFAYSLDSGPVEVIDLTPPGATLPPYLVQALLNDEVKKHAYNAAFEWFCLSKYLNFSEAQAVAWLEQWEDTMLRAQYHGFPASLAAAGRAIGLSEDKKKDAAGRALIRYFCVPCKPTKMNGQRTRNLPRHDADKWRLFIAYNRQDVVTEMAIAEALPLVPEELHRQWRMNQRINLRGVLVDLDLMDGALFCGDAEREVLTREALRLTGIENPNSVAQLSAWLEAETDTEIQDLRKSTVKNLLSGELPGEKARRVLEIRQELGKTSTKKYAAMETCACADGRIRGLLQFYGANRTGREAGRLVQVQNLPNDTVPAEEAARELVKTRNAAGIKVVYGSLQNTLSALIRTAFIAAPGKLFIDADFSAIEARVIAWLAGEEWALQVFRTHGRIYEATAAQMFNIPIERIQKGNPEYTYRAKGKVATLALGYQGGANALIAMGALKNGLTEEELPDIVTRWRRSNRNIVQFWHDVERAAVEAVIAGKSTCIGKVTLMKKGRFLVITLPSGRELFYRDPHFGKNRFGNESLIYWGMDQTSKRWTQIETYGGKLVENITQAVARDCLFYAMERLEAAGYEIVFDVHDEVVIEVPEDRADLDDVIRIMREPAPWAQTLPLNADGWAGAYYRKD